MAQSIQWFKWLISLHMIPDSLSPPKEHILPLAEENAEANCGSGAAAHGVPQLARCVWGCKEDAQAALALSSQPPDLITAAGT